MSKVAARVGMILRRAQFHLIREKTFSSLLNFLRFTQPGSKLTLPPGRTMSIGIRTGHPRLASKARLPATSANGRVTERHV